MNAQDPHPDEDTLLTLIETNDQLSLALSKYQRAILNARKRVSRDPSPNPIAHQIYHPMDPSPHSTALAPAASGKQNLTSPPSSALAPPVPGHLAPSGPVANEMPIRFLPAALSATQPQARLENPFDDSNDLVAGISSSEPPTAPLQDTTYHPGYRPTQSYVKRQDSEANNITVRGICGTDREADVEEEEPDSPEQPRRYRF